MANILYRGSAAPTVTNSAGANNGPLTNDQIDKNFFALDSAKFEKSGGTVSGDTTFSTNVTISGNIDSGVSHIISQDGTADKQELLGKGQSTMKEDVAALFADDETISEEFKEKVSTIFEARVNDRIAQLEEETEARYAGMLEEAVESIKQDLTEKVDDYLSYIVEQWMEENQIAIESGLRAEMTEDFIAGLRNLFAENYIDVPAEKVDLVEELAAKVEELEGKLNEEIDRGVSYAKALVESRKSEITREVCEGLTVTQVEKIKSLAESVEFSTEDEYKNKLETIRENYFPSGTKRANEEQLHEEIGESDEKTVADPMVAAVAKVISKTRI